MSLGLKFVAALQPLADRLGVPVDKLAHFVAGAVAALPGCLFIDNPLAGSLVGTGTAYAAGRLKERYDAKHADRHSVESKDALATTLGGLAVSVANYAIRIALGG